MAPKYILNYFDVPGRAEAIRLMLHAAGVEFTDNRMVFTEWPTLKQDTRKFPLNKGPTLEVDDTVIIQSKAISRFVARRFGLYGNDDLEAAVVDQVCEVVLDYATDAMNISYSQVDDETKKTKFGEYFASDKLKNELTYIENVLKRNKGGFFLGEKPTMADFQFYGVHLTMIPVNDKYLDQFTELKALIERVENIANVKKYLDSRKK